MSIEQFMAKPDIKISVKQTFGFDSEMQINAFSKKNEYVPKVDSDYKFDKDTTLAILAGFSFNKRVWMPKAANILDLSLNFGLTNLSMCHCCFIVEPLLLRS